jgi:succinoglycan biosynthesis protein ExoM
MHVTVCICTYRRPELLRRLLFSLDRQLVADAFTYSVVVADNDEDGAGRPIVDEVAACTRLRINYCSEPKRNIALARNQALKHAVGDYVAWIDDDELPAPDWLSSLVAAAGRYAASGIVGPVRPLFEQTPPRWLIAGKFCERPEYPSGTRMHWSRCFAGNALVHSDVFRTLDAPFRAEFGLGGEDVDFFRRMTASGHVFVWCNEAVVEEIIPPSRWTRSYRLKRAMLHGRNSLMIADRIAVTKSVVAVPAYLAAWPFSLLFGQHVFMLCGVRLSGHLGRLLALAGINLVKERPV